MSLAHSDIIIGLDSGNAYTVTAQLGAGGFGTAYLLTDDASNTYVAKTTDPHDARKVKALHNEYKVLKHLEGQNVPNVVRAVEMSRYDDSFGVSVDVLIMHKAAGDSLESVLLRGPLAPDDAMEVTCCIAKALAACHAAGIIHRDISPDNIFIDDVGGANEVTLIDFGIAAMKSDSDTHVLVSLIAGKAFYSPPEQLTEGGTRVSIGNDIFSVAATAVALLIGEQKVREFVASGATQYPYGFHSNVSGVNPMLDNAIKKGTWRDRSGRFAVMQDFVDVLEGKVPDESYPRLVHDATVSVLVGDGPWMVGRMGSATAQVSVAERSPQPYISRDHLLITKTGDGVFQLEDMSLNGTRINMGGRWLSLKDPPLNNQFKIGARYEELALGYTSNPPADAKDNNGNPLQPGPYKIIEFFPPQASP